MKLGFNNFVNFSLILKFNLYQGRSEAYLGLLETIKMKRFWKNTKGSLILND